MLEWIEELIKRIITPKVFSVAATVLTVAPLIVMLAVAVFGGGEARKIRAGFRKVIKASKNGGSAFDEAMKMPLHVRSAVERSKQTGALPSELMPEHNCVFVPCAYSQKNNLGIITAVSALTCSVLLFALGRAAGMAEQTVFAAVSASMIVGAVSSVIGAAVAIAFKRRVKRTFSQAVAVLDAEMKSGFAPDTVEVESVPDFADEPEPKNETDGPVDYDATVYSYEESDFAVGEEPQREDVIARVEQIAEYGASIEEMKEVASLLRLERMKPENRTPSKKKKLDEAFASLLRSASNAKK